ncbi:hypothetical protein ACF1G3_39480 [Streptomyces rochei]|uniref:hypothetical protein n=1 Tax=Streptomyces rochei TaxID=1928 RepID=UPI0036FB316E
MRLVSRGETEGADALRAAVRERAERGCDMDLWVLDKDGNLLSDPIDGWSSLRRPRVRRAAYPVCTARRTGTVR